MIMKFFKIRTIVLLMTLFAATCVVADEEIETIELHNRTSEDVIPILKPMVKPGGAITGTGYKLIIRSTAENIDEIKQLLASIDTEIKTVLITVATRAQVDHSRNAARAQINIDSGATHVQAGEVDPGAPGGSMSASKEGVSVESQIIATQSHQDTPGMQQMRVAEGTWGSIQMGQAIPTTTRHRNPDGTVTATITYKNITSGFEVMPRINGGEVNLMIRPFKSALSAQGGGVIDTQSMETSIRGKIGEWISLGGSASSSATDSSGIVSRTQLRDAQIDQLWVKVEVLN